MSINPLVAAGPATIAGAGTSPSFGQVLSGAPSPGPRLETQPLAGPTPGPSAARAAPGPCRAGAADGAVKVEAAQVLERVTRAQQRMEAVLTLAQSGRSFSPAELLALQAQVYRASQELDLAGKVVEKLTGGVKQVLQTQV